MDKELEQFRRNLKEIKLEPMEKQKARAHLFAYMETHPKISSPGFFSSLAFYKYAMGGTVAFGAILLMGLSVWAEKALPGDVAYPIKVEVTEPFRDAVAVTNEADLSWDITEAERRMEEAERLATRAGF